MLRPRAEPERRSGWPARRIAGAVAVLAATLVPWSWFVVRDLSPAMDLIAVGLPAGALALTVVALAVAAVWGRPYAAVPALSLLVFAVVVIAEPRTPEPTGAPERSFRLVAANLFNANTRPRDAARAIADLEPQVVVAVETSHAAVRALVARFAAYDHASTGGLHVFSAWPVGREGAVDGISPAIVRRIDIVRPESPFVLYAIHLPNPLHEISFERSLELVDAVVASAEREDLPVVLAGDLNVGDRSQGYRRLHERFRDAMRAGWASSTYDRGPWLVVQLRIDHVFVSDEVCASGAKVFELPGSDHDGLRVQLGTCR